MRRVTAFLICLALLCALPARARAAQKRIALTFDDGPNGKVTQRILDLLKEQDVPATFFVCGEQAERYPELLQRMAQEGHEIGLHSYCHCYMDSMEEAEILDDFASCLCAVSEACGVRPKLFRPPGGRYSETLVKCAGQEKLSVVLWSIDTLDWNRRENGRSLSRILQQAADGQIILMHDLLRPSCEIAEKAVAQLKSDGYEFCTVSELLGAPEAGRVYFAAA